jgi:hypothetical protein
LLQIPCNVDPRDPYMAPISGISQSCQGPRNRVAAVVVYRRSRIRLRERQREGGQPYGEEHETGDQDNRGEPREQVVQDDGEREVGRRSGAVIERFMSSAPGDAMSAGWRERWMTLAP